MFVGRAINYFWLHIKILSFEGKQIRVPFQQSTVITFDLVTPPITTVITPSLPCGESHTQLASFAKVRTTSTLHMHGTNYLEIYKMEQHLTEQSAQITYYIMPAYIRYFRHKTIDLFVISECLTEYY